MNSKNALLSVLVAILGFIAFYGIITAKYPALMAFVLSVAILIVTGMIFQKINSLEGSYGLNLLRSNAGIGALDRISKWNPKVWDTLADLGLVFGYGLLAYFILDGRKANPKKFYVKFAISIFILLFASFMVVPYVFPLATTVITNTDITSASSQVRAATSSFPFFAIAALAMLVVGGLALSAVSSLLAYAAYIIYALSTSAISGSGAISKTASGASFLLPGINLPFAEGLIALAILLVIHESAHGILSRNANVKLKSAGIVLFGFLPVGAFIDPDEKQLVKKSRIQQLRVMVAGSTINILGSFVAFALLLLFAFATYGLRPDAIRVVSGTPIIPNGTYIYSVNGVGAQNIAGMKFTPNEPLAISANTGTIQTTTNSNGKVGIGYYEAPKSDYPISVFPPEFSYLKFIYTTLALLFVLNFLVGTVNLLPLPMFDGHRIAELAFNNKKLVYYIVVAVALAFAANFIPALFK